MASSIISNIKNNKLIQTGIENLKDYVNLGGKMTKAYAKTILTNAFKQYIDIDEVAITPMETSIDGFKFHIVEREEIKYESEVSDYFVDTNIAIQDHIAWKPIEVTLTLQQGEYFNDITTNVGHSLAYYQVASLVNSLLPKMSTNTLARKVKSTISRLTGGTGMINSITNKATSITYGVMLSALKSLNFDLFNKNKGTAQSTTSSTQTTLDIWRTKSPQVDAFISMQGLWRLGMPIRVITSWKTFENMVITNMKVSRDSNADISEFTITLKEIKTVQSLVAEEKKKSCSARVGDQKSDVQDNGKTKGKEVTLKGKL